MMTKDMTQVHDKVLADFHGQTLKSGIVSQLCEVMDWRMDIAGSHCLYFVAIVYPTEVIVMFVAVIV